MSRRCISLMSGCHSQIVPSARHCVHTIKKKLSSHTGIVPYWHTCKPPVMSVLLTPSQQMEQATDDLRRACNISDDRSEWEGTQSAQDSTAPDQTGSVLTSLPESLERPGWVSLVSLMISMWPDQGLQLQSLLTIASLNPHLTVLDDDLREAVGHIIGSLFPHGLIVEVPIAHGGPPPSPFLALHRGKGPIPLPMIATNLYLQVVSMSPPPDALSMCIYRVKLAWCRQSASESIESMMDIYAAGPESIARDFARCANLTGRRGGPRPILTSRTRSWIRFFSS
jgi:hypothetical protein